jgi:LCP family protein required for cell wall assembly
MTFGNGDGGTPPTPAEEPTAPPERDVAEAQSPGAAPGSAAPDTLGDPSAPPEVTDATGEAADDVPLDSLDAAAAGGSGAALTTLKAWRSRRRTHKAARSTLRRRLVRTGIGVVVIVVLLVVGAFIYSSYRFGQIHRVATTHVVRATGPTENILLIGSTDRCSATEIRQFAVQCAKGVNGINSDVVLILHLDPATGKASILSIPRDTFVPDARAGGLYDKVDAALFNGPDQLAAAIEQDFGIPINHFVELNFESFEGVVNALGGLHLYFPNRLVDASSGLNVHHTGCLPFNGSEALELVRARHLYWFKRHQKTNYAAIQAATDNGTYYTPDSGGQYDGTGDLGRIVRVHLFLKALAAKVKASGLGDPFTDNSLIGAIAPNLTVDSTFSDSAILHLALDFRHVNVSATPELTVPIVNDAATYEYKGYDYGLVVFPTEPQDSQAIDEFLGSTPPGLKLKPSSISVSVVDGSGSASATATVATELGALGYRMVPTTATNIVGPVAETTVEYAPGHLQQAERVESSLSGTVVLGEGTPAAGADISVIAGTTLTVAAPTSAHTSAAVTGGSPTAAVLTSASSTATSAANPNLGAPTAANPAPTSFDPRACPAQP